ncbi:MAG: hypothetical protein ACXWQQ_15315 [Pseudobdellovibrio sp.]
MNANTIYAGEVSGSVTLLQKNANSTWEHAASNEGVVLYITGFEEKDRKSSNLYELKQQNKAFSPRVLAITVGDDVMFSNFDDIYHNIWSLSKAKTFDLGSYKAPEKKKVNFDTAGLVKVFCNIHPQMISSILVLKNSKFFVTSGSGKFLIKDVPAGNFQLRAWLEGADPIVKDIVVTKDSKSKFDFEIKSPEVTEEHLDKNGKPYKKY